MSEHRHREYVEGCRQCWEAETLRVIREAKAAHPPPCELFTTTTGGCTCPDYQDGAYY